MRVRVRVRVHRRDGPRARTDAPSAPSGASVEAAWQIAEEIAPEAGARGSLYVGDLRKLPSVDERESYGVCQQDASEGKDGRRGRTYYYIRYNCGQADKACQSFALNEVGYQDARYEGL